MYKPVLTVHELLQLSTKEQNRRLLVRLYRLSHQLPKRKYQDVYGRLIRQRCLIPYERRLELVLNKQSTELNKEQQLQRRLNTLAFLEDALLRRDGSKHRIVMNLLEHELSKRVYILRHVKASPALENSMDHLHYWEPGNPLYNHDLLASTRLFDQCLMMANESAQMEL
ncbi:unnamed protein product [Cyberlindnera jadinii]|uniref:Uncharacterized protein n=1 Tax=Cyberlindnera jadinii (strain ATCC 18201 / CBS 1600 / BCRC 20928 / JCM 3617 / NBRC 0987 / NRRL Y-1542) TaxID=983966 RepID=A0A0H5BZ73_CYBJN|nr:unnamed protein product [Cyberlindnera jadinii]